MSELTKEQLQEAKSKLSGLKVWYIVAIILFAIGIFIYALLTVLAPIMVGVGLGLDDSPLPIIGTLFGMLIAMFISFVLLVLNIIALIGLNLRKPFAYPVGMASLILVMFWIPVGIIIGAIFLSRLNTPLAKKYLNFGV